MKLKKVLAFVLAASLIAGCTLTGTVMAEEPAEKLEVLISGKYSIEPLAYSESDSNHNIFKVGKPQGESLKNSEHYDSPRTDGYYYGLISESGEWITQMQWIGIMPFSPEGLALVQNFNLQWGAIDRNGKLVINDEWDTIDISMGIAVVCKNGRFGLQSLNGNIVAEPVYDSIGIFHEGIASVYKDGKCGFINTSGTVISDVQWKNAYDFSEDYAPVQNENGKWGYINSDGKTVLDFIYDNVGMFTDNIAFVEKDQEVYPIDKTGKRLSDKSFEAEYGCLGDLYAPNFGGADKNIACVKIAGENNYCYIDKSFNQLTESIYSFKVDFDDENTAIVVSNDKYSLLKYENNAVKEILKDKTYIRLMQTDFVNLFESEHHLYNASGKDLFGGAFDECWYEYGSGDDFVRFEKDKKYTLTDFEGNKLYGPSDYRVTTLSENSYIATSDSDCMILDKLFNELIELPNYSEIKRKDDLVYVKLNGKWGIDTSDGKVLISPQYDDIFDICDDWVKVENNGKFGYVNVMTDEKIETKFVNGSDFQEGYAWVTEKTFTGAIDTKGNYIVKPIYWAYDDDTGFGCNYFSHGVTSVRRHKDSSYEIINKKGQRLTNEKYQYVSAFNSSGVAYFITDENEQGLIKVVDNTSPVKPDRLELDKTSVNTYVGSYVDVKSTVTPETATNKQVVFKSANTDVATVDETGRIYGVKAGTTTVTASLDADSGIMQNITVTVEDWGKHSDETVIPDSAWEGQYWLADYVIENLKALNIIKSRTELTYGDLKTVSEINIPYIEDTFDSNTEQNVYHIPSIIAEFSNLVVFRIGSDKFLDEGYSNNKSLNFDPWYDARFDSMYRFERSEHFTPLVGGMPDSAKYLSSLSLVEIENTYGDSYNPNIIRSGKNGITDMNLYKALNINWNPFGVYNTLTSSWYSDLSNKNISDLKGFGLITVSENLKLNFKYNYISDISELLNLKNVEIDLSYNNLDLKDSKTLSVLEKLKANGCTVNTDNQNGIAFIKEPVGQSSIPARKYDWEVCNSWDFKIYPKTIGKDLVIKSSDTNVLDVAGGSDGFLLMPNSKGKATVSISYKDKVLWSKEIEVRDPSLGAEDINVKVNVSDWDPTYAEISLDNNDISLIQYRKASDSVWKDYQRYYTRIYKNGTYVFRYRNTAGLFSNEKEVVIDSIKEELTEEQIPDAALRKVLSESNGKLYKGKKITNASFSGYGIKDLKGLSLLDFSNLSYLDLRFNYITDISELKNISLNINQAPYINLSKNRLDLNDEATKDVIKAITDSKIGINVEDQNLETPKFDTSMLPFNDNIYMIKSVTVAGTNFMVYPADKAEVKVISSDPEIADVENLNKNGSRFTLSFKTGKKTGKAEFDILINGESAKKINVYVYEKNNAPAPEFKVTEYYSYNNSYYVKWENYINNVFLQYRIKGTDSWSSYAYGANFYIYSDGIYEFRYQYSSYPYLYSPVTTIELKRLEFDGLKMFTNGKGLTVYGYSGDQKSINIKGSYDGRRVTTIRTFYSYVLNDIVIPEGVERIESGNSFHLNSITIPESVNYIDEFCFDSGTNKIICYKDSYAHKFAIEHNLSNIEFLAKKNVESKTEAPIKITVSGNKDTLPESNVTLDVSQAKSEELETPEIKENIKILDAEKTLAYNIDLKNDKDEKIQPNGSIKVSLEVPEEMDGVNCKIFRVEEDGTLTDMNAVFKDGKLYFYTEHFSLYIIAQEKTNTLGDVNGDGLIDIVDLQRLYAHLNGSNPLENKAVGDINGDGLIDIVDLQRLYAHLNGSNPLS